MSLVKSITDLGHDAIVKNFTDASKLGINITNRLWLNIVKRWQGIQTVKITHVYYSMYIEEVPEKLAFPFKVVGDVQAYIDEVDEEEIDRTLLEGLVSMPGVDSGHHDLQDATDIYYDFNQLDHGAYYTDGQYHNVLNADVSEKVNPMVKDAIQRHMGSGDYVNTGVLVRGDTVLDKSRLSKLIEVDQLIISVVPYYGNNVILFVYID